MAFLGGHCCDGFFEVMESTILLMASLESWGKALLGIVINSRWLGLWPLAF
jgi:hypothetical protein